MSLAPVSPRSIESVFNLEKLITDLSKDDDNAWIKKYIKNLRNSSSSRQVIVGSVSGWFSGFVFTKFGKAAATGIGATLILLHLANHHGYVKVDWKRLNKDVEKAKKELEKRAKKDLPKILESSQQFLIENMLLAGGFAGGFFLGIASA